MTNFELMSEAVAALPERLETSEFNIAGVSLRQSNLNVQIALGAVQLAGQSNTAGVLVVQST